MIAASFWSLLSPAIEIAENSSLPSWFPAAIGFLMGGFFLWAADKVIPHVHPTSPMKDAEGIRPETNSQVARPSVLLHEEGAVLLASA